MTTMTANSIFVDTNTSHFLERITVDPDIYGGKPCIRGLRFPVSRLLGLLAAGETPETILQSYPYLEADDIQAAFQYAALLADEQVIEFA